MLLTMGFRNSLSLLPAIRATRLLVFTLAGLTPAEHASLRWTHTCYFPLADLRDGARDLPQAARRGVTVGLPQTHAQQLLYTGAGVCQFSGSGE